MFAGEELAAVLVDLEDGGGGVIEGGEAGGLRVFGTAELCKDFSLGGEGGEVGLSNEGRGDGGLGPDEGFGEVQVAFEAELDGLEISGPVEAGDGFELFADAGEVDLIDVADGELVGEVLAEVMFGGLGGDAEGVFGGFVEEATPAGGVLGGRRLYGGRSGQRGGVDR